MIALIELTKQRAWLASELEVLDGKIASHPDNIVKSFPETSQDVRLAPIIANVVAIQDAEGKTNSRKNQMSWSGSTFKLRGDDKLYTYRHGSNWCSSVCDCGPDDDSMTDLDRNWIMNSHVDDKLTDEAVAKLLAMPRHMAAAYLLTIEEGW